MAAWTAACCNFNQLVLAGNADSDADAEVDLAVIFIFDDQS